MKKVQGGGGSRDRGRGRGRRGSIEGKKKIKKSNITTIIPSSI